MNPRGALLPFYLAVVVLGGIIAHLAAELFALGPDFGSLALSPRHAYLGLIAAAALCYAIANGLRLWRQSANGRDLKRILNLQLASLPAGGRGPAFFLITALVQFGFGVTTEIGEGCPFCGHDVTAGIIGALVLSLTLALASRAIARALPRLAAAVAAALQIVHAATAAPARLRQRATSIVIASLDVVSRLGPRPPPVLQA